MCARLLGGSGRGSHDGDIDDAVQQTFLEAWRCLHRFEGKSRFTTWLTRIAIHTSFSVRRRLRRLLLADDDRRGLTVVDGDSQTGQGGHGIGAYANLAGSTPADLGSGPD
ncbi:MAG: sigma factor, partial [bacterium]